MISENKNNKIRILYIYPSLEIGGAEELRFLVLKNLRHKANYDLRVCCIENIGEIGEKIKGLGIEVFCLYKSANPKSLSTTISLMKYLLKNKFDIVQTSLFNANFHGRIAAALAGVPIIISEEHSEHYQYKSLKFLPHVWSDKILSIFTDKIICCSKNLMSSISKLEKIPSRKFFVILNTFNIEKLKATKNPLVLREELGLSGTDIVVSNIASLSYRKGQDLLIKAFKIINNKVPATKLILIGRESREFKQKIAGLIKDLGLQEKVLLLGEKSNIADYLNITDIFVLSSRYEGIPLAMLEAMYMQVPVVVAGLGGVTEVITNGKDGFLTEPNNIGSLSKVILELIEDKDKRIRLGQEGKKTVLEKFNTERYIGELENLYGTLYKKKLPNSCCYASFA